MKILKTVSLFKDYNNRIFLLSNKNLFRSCFFDDKIIACNESVLYLESIYEWEKEDFKDFVDFLSSKNIDFTILSPTVEYSKKDISKIEEKYKYFYYTSINKEFDNLNHSRDDVNYCVMLTQKLRIKEISNNIVIFKKNYDKKDDFIYDLFFVDNKLALFKRKDTNNSLTFFVKFLEKSEIDEIIQ